MASHGDPIPKDHISAVEAFEIYRNTKHGTDCNEQPSPGAEEWKAWYKQQSLDIDADETALLQPFLTGELEALVSENGGREYRITPKELAAAKWPSRFFLSSQIFDFRDGPLARFDGRTPYINRARFLDWLKLWFRNYLFDEIANGKLLAIDAEARLAELGFEPLYDEPKVQDFHPENETYWTLAMSVAWISWRNTAAVTRKWEKYTHICRYWRSSKVPDQIKTGAILESCERPSLANLMAYESLEIKHSELGEQVATIKWARENLWSKLQADELEAYGKHPHSERVVMESHLWIDLVVGGFGTKHEFLTQHLGSPSPNDWHEVMLKREAVMRIWPSKDAPKNDDEKHLLGRNDGHKQSAIGQAMDATFPPDGMPPIGLAAKERDNKIRKWIDDNQLTAPATAAALSKAIQREIKKRTQRA